MLELIDNNLIGVYKSNDCEVLGAYVFSVPEVPRIYLLYYFYLILLRDTCAVLGTGAKVDNRRAKEN